MPNDSKNTYAPKILICEDEQLIAQDLSKTLKELGYEVVGIFSIGEEAIRAAEGAKP